MENSSATGAISELGHRMGLSFNKIDQDSQFPSSAKEIVNEYKIASDGLIKEIKEKWNAGTGVIIKQLFFTLQKF